jgi:hypothetical protein
MILEEQDQQTKVVNHLNSEDYVARLIVESENLINDIHKELVIDYNTLSNPLPEDIFVRYFLPYFSGLRPISENKNIINEWISIAGNPSAKVSIINQTGKEIYKVPGIQNTNILNITDRRPQETFPEIGVTIDAYSNSAQPAYLNNFISTSYGEKLNSLIKPTLDTTIIEDQAQWNMIFERYGIKDKNKIDTTGEEENLDDGIIF